MHTKPTLSQKRKLHADLKALHGQHWHPGMKPIYDERGSAAIMITRFDPAWASRITQYPAIHWMELELDLANPLEAIQRMIPELLDGASQHLEYLEISNTLDVDRSTEVMRDALPADPRPFGRLPSLQQVIFNRLKVSDRLVKELCKNQSIESISIREGDITKRCVKYFAACPRLVHLDLVRCPHFAPGDQQKLRERLPAVEIVHVT